MANRKKFEELMEEMQEEINSASSEINIIIEKAKKEQKKSNSIALIVCIIIDFLIIFKLLGPVLQSGHKLGLMFIAMCVFVVDIFIVLISNMIFGKSRMVYSTKFKEIIIQKLMSNVYDDLEYFPYKGMPKTIYNEGKYEFYDEYDSDDYLEAKINNKYDIEMAEVHTKEVKIERDSEGNTHEETYTLFHGLFAKIVIDKSINSELRIRQNSIIKLDKTKLEMDSRRI